jgi:hypothetical protein
LRAIARTGCALTIVIACIAGFTTTASAAESDPVIAGYWGVDAAGQIRRSGDAPDLGDTGALQLNAPIVGIAALPGGGGYWLAAADGGVFAFGQANFYGSAANLHLNAPIVGIAAADQGYWLVASDGGVFAFGDARFYGSAANLHLNAPIVGIAPSYRGYLLAASDGGVFAYGNANFYGSAANMHLNSPIVAIASAGVGGYRLVGGDGGVFTFGDANFFGSAVGLATSAITTSYFGGYALQSSVDGSLFAFGNASSCVEISSPVVVPQVEAVGSSSHADERASSLGSARRFVGVAFAFDVGRGDVEGRMAAVSCQARGGDTGAFHAPARWHVDTGKGFDHTGPACFTEVFARDRVGTQPVPLRPLVAKFGSIQMRRTQMAGHSVFDVRVTGVNCRAVATRSFFSLPGLPLTTQARGDIGPFSAFALTVEAHGTCSTEVRANDDGRLVTRRTGSSYTINLPAGTYWISNSKGCTVSVS